jgi:hypothetical protein
MRLYLSVSALAAVLLMGLPSPGFAASAAALSKCKATEKDRQIFLVDPDLRVQNITCAKARKKIVYSDKRCGAEPGKSCRFTASGFSCRTKTSDSYYVTTKCTKKLKSKVQKVNLAYQSGLG